MSQCALHKEQRFVSFVVFISFILHKIRNNWKILILEMVIQRTGKKEKENGIHFEKLVWFVQ